MAAKLTPEQVLELLAHAVNTSISSSDPPRVVCAARVAYRNCDSDTLLVTVVQPGGRNDNYLVRCTVTPVEG